MLKKGKRVNFKKLSFKFKLSTVIAEVTAKTF